MNEKTRARVLKTTIPLWQNSSYLYGSFEYPGPEYHITDTKKE